MSSVVLVWICVYVSCDSPQIPPIDDVNSISATYRSGPPWREKKLEVMDDIVNKSAVLTPLVQTCRVDELKWAVYGNVVITKTNGEAITINLFGGKAKRLVIELDDVYYQSSNITLADFDAILSRSSKLISDTAMP
jgi:hypothetical protein